MGNKIRVDGIKLSQELIQVNILTRPGTKDLNTRFLRSMAENRINCPILFYSAMDRRSHSAVCITSEDSHRLNQMLALDPDLKENVKYISPVGAMSLFPHKFSLKLLGCLMHVFGKTGLPIYGMAASLSALTLTTDFHVLDGAIESLMPFISLPPGHAPFRPQLRIKAL
ncbi:hypothetical protein ACFL2E_04920 [Thermodesulfobacteriota bacterium]